MFVTVSFLPFPTALVLGFGYPIINAARSAMPGPASIVPGLGVYALLTLCLWVIALLSPIMLFIGMRSMRPFSSMAAGFLGAVSATSLASASNKVGKAGRAATNAASSAASSSRVDPVQGSPFSSDNTGSTGAVGATGTSAAGALGSASGGLARSGNSATTSLGASSTSSSSGTSRESFTDSRIPSGVSLNNVVSRSDLASDQKYRAGYFKPDGEFEGVGGTTSDRDWTLNKGYERLDKAYPDKTLVLQGAEDDEFYDIREVIENERYGGPYSYAQQTAESRETVFNTRGQNE